MKKQAKKTKNRTSAKKSAPVRSKKKQLKKTTEKNHSRKELVTGTKKKIIRKSREPENQQAIEVIQETILLNPDNNFIVEMEETGEPEVVELENEETGDENEVISGETEIEIREI